MSKFVRFIALQNDRFSQKPQGIFQSIFDLRDDGKLSESDLIWFDETMKWFNKNLKTPTKFNSSNKKYAQNTALCWYKSDAHEYINKMYGLIHILEQHDVPTEIIRTDKPGYIVYDDEHQVVAEPFIETKGRKLKR